MHFWGEYTPHEHTGGLKWGYSSTNQLIANFKKRMDRSTLPEWRYKVQAIETVASNFAKFWKWRDLHLEHRPCLIPLPPSRARANPLYDPRMLEVLRVLAVTTALPLDIRDCLSFTGQYRASHEADARPSPDELYLDLTVDTLAGRPSEPPDLIFVFDDILTTGAHFVAATRRLRELFPAAQIVGNFIARRIVPSHYSDFEIPAGG